MSEDRIMSDALARRLLTVREVMESMALGRYKIYDLIRSGQLESIQVGRSRRVSVEAVDACVARLREEAASGVQQSGVRISR